MKPETKKITSKKKLGFIAIALSAVSFFGFVTLAFALNGGNHLSTEDYDSTVGCSNSGNTVYIYQNPGATGVGGDFGQVPCTGTGFDWQTAIGNGQWKLVELNGSYPDLSCQTDTYTQCIAEPTFVAETDVVVASSFGNTPMTPPDIQSMSVGFIATHLGSILTTSFLPLLALVAGLIGLGILIMYVRRFIGKK